MDDLDNIIAYVKNLPMYYSLYVGRVIKCGEQFKSPWSKRLLEYEKMVNTFGRLNNREFRNSKNGFACVALKSAYFITARGKCSHVRC